jgi:hypothetical protein
MALLDFILDRTGAIGAKIRGYNLIAGRDAAIMKKPRSPQHTTIITADYKVLAFDAATSIGHQFSSKVTSYSVEDRSTVSDHVVNSNPTFTVSGVFSDASAPSTPTKTKSEVKSLLASAGIGGNTRHHQYTQSETYRLLLKIRDDRKTITLITPIDTYTDLILTELSIPRATGQGDALFVDMTFEKIRRVSNELTTVFIGSSGANKKVAATTGDTKVKVETPKNAGSIPVHIAAPDAKTRATSIIDGATYWVKVVGLIDDGDIEAAKVAINKGGI